MTLSKVTERRIVEAFLVLFEATQVIASVADVGLDVLVCVEFYNRELWIPFYASVFVFCAAQTAYAFLFAATYARNVRTVRGKVRAFLIALPLAQLVPLFNWLESFHFSSVETALVRLGLSPSGTTVVEDGDAKVSQAPQASLEEDHALWTFAHKKFKANVGFLVEAIVEAVPQAMIQTYVVVVYGEADWLIVTSILMSVFVVASKGYMLAYSIHAWTFLFNSLSVFADICGLFATLVWAFAACSVDSLISPEPSWLYSTWKDLAIGGALLTAVAGFCLATYANFDDHLKILLFPKGRWRCKVRLATDIPWFDLWTIRSVTWMLALLPASVLMLSLKISALPLLYFKSLQPSHFTFPQVNRRVFAFINRGGRDKVSARLRELNALLRLAMIDADKAPRNSYILYYQAAVVGSPVSKTNLRTYIQNLGRTTVFFTWKQTSVSDADGTQEPESTTLQQAERNAVRKENQRKFTERELTELEKRSVIWWLLMGARHDSEFPKPTSSADEDSSTTSTAEEDEDAESVEDEVKPRWCGRRWAECKRNSAKENAMMLSGIVFFILSAITIALLVPVLCVLASLSIAIPFIGPYRFLYHGIGMEGLAVEAALGLSLSFSYALCVFVLALLYPSVHAFQSLYKDILDFSDHTVLGEDSFYKVGLDMILEEAYRRHRERLGKEVLRDYLETRANTDGARAIMRFLTGTEAF